MSASLVVGRPHELMLTWKQPLEPNGILIQYTIYYQSMADNTTESERIFAEEETFISFINKTSAVINGLRPYTYYKCHMTYSTSIGEGNFSKPVLSITDESSM